MSIMTRFIRLCKADIHGVMDQLEDKGLLLKQYLRDMEQELGRKESSLEEMISSRARAQREFERYTRECEKLDRDIEAAIAKDMDDIARSLIKKLKPLACHCDELGRHIQTVGWEISQLRECVAGQRLQHEQLKLRSKEYFRRVERKGWEKIVSSTTPSVASGKVSEAEVELELLERKETSNGGARK